MARLSVLPLWEYIASFDAATVTVRAGDSPHIFAASITVGTFSPAIDAAIALLVITLNMLLQQPIKIRTVASNSLAAIRTICMHSSHPLSKVLECRYYITNLPFLQAKAQ